MGIAQAHNLYRTDRQTYRFVAHTTNGRLFYTIMYFESDFDIDKCEYAPNKYIEGELRRFHSLPEKAQDIYLRYFLSLKINNDKDKYSYDDSAYFIEYLTSIYGEVTLCKSPIEQTLYCALNFILQLKYPGQLSHGYYVRPQYEIQTDKQKRIMDFAVIDEDCEPENNIVLFIECDGFDYHAKTKEQFTYTQQKDRELKTMGYDVLHFTGTEIYSNPLKCADEVWKFVKKREENNG